MLSRREALRRLGLMGVTGCGRVGPARGRAAMTTTPPRRPGGVDDHGGRNRVDDGCDRGAVELGSAVDRRGVGDDGTGSR